MTKIESNEKVIQKSARQVFDYLTDFTNFKQLIPDGTKDFTAQKDSFSFATGIGKFGIQAATHVPHSAVRMKSDASTPVDFTLEVQINTVSENQCRVKIISNAKLNFMQKAVAMTPLKNFGNSLVEKLSRLDF